LEDKKDIVVCLSRFPFPLEKGDKLRAFHHLKSLSGIFNITLICVSDKDVTPEEMARVKEFCKSIHVFKLTKAGLLFQLLLSLFSKKPFQVQYFYRPGIRKKVSEILAEVKPYHIYCQLVRCSEYVKNYHFCPKTIDYMDALSKGMERRIESEPFYKSWFYKLETKRLRRYETLTFDYFENHIIISEQDKNHIHHPKKHKIHVVPNGVDESFFEDLNIQKKYDLIFTGNFSYAPNVAAALFLVNKIMPELQKRNIRLSLLLAGANPNKEVQNLASENVVVTGWVDDIRVSYQSAHFFVAPLFIGTGLQNKLLEAMASNLPCLTTPLVNNALGGTDGKNILLAEDLNEFVEKIVTYKTELDSFNEISHNGQRFVLKNYSWQTQNSKLLLLFSSSPF